MLLPGETQLLVGVCSCLNMGWHAGVCRHASLCAPECLCLFMSVCACAHKCDCVCRNVCVTGCARLCPCTYLFVGPVKGLSKAPRKQIRKQAVSTCIRPIRQTEISHEHETLWQWCSNDQFWAEVLCIRRCHISQGDLGTFPNTLIAPLSFCNLSSRCAKRQFPAHTLGLCVFQKIKPSHPELR